MSAEAAKWKRDEDDKVGGEADWIALEEHELSVVSLRSIRWTIKRTDLTRC